MVDTIVGISVLVIFLGLIALTSRALKRLEKVTKEQDKLSVKLKAAEADSAKLQKKLIQTETTAALLVRKLDALHRNCLELTEEQLRLERRVHAEAKLIRIDTEKHVASLSQLFGKEYPPRPEMLTPVVYDEPAGILLKNYSSLEEFEISHK